MRVEILLIAFGFFVTALVSSMLTKYCMTGRGKDPDDEAVYHLVCSLAPRCCEGENWQVRAVFTTPVGTRCQYYIEVSSNVDEYEAVKIACDQALSFIRGIRF